MMTSWLTFSFFGLGFSGAGTRSVGTATRAVRVGLLALAALIASPLLAQSSGFTDDGYKIRPDGESEFDNQSGSFVKDWRTSVPQDEYEDTEFGENLYNEPSTPTKLEVLRLLSKDTPSMLVFMQAVSMGLSIENALQAAVKYEPEKGRDFAASAVNILPVLQDSKKYLYSSYEVDELERDDESQPYSIAEVAEKFFADRLVLRPYPDWMEGQYHFLASAAELKGFADTQPQTDWYRTKSSQDVDKRPIFVSLYEDDRTVLVDGDDRIRQALRADPNARLPVVFIFNRLNERAVDDLGYPKTLRGVQSAYIERELLVTPTPEWQLGEYHLYAKMSEIYDIFDIPEEDDFEPETWQKLLEEAEDYKITDTSFLVVLIGTDKGEEGQTATRTITSSLLQIAAFDDPRTESNFPYVAPSDGAPVTLKNIMAQGIIINRPDLIAGLNALGVTEIPIAVYYLDKSRVTPYTKTPRALIAAAVGARVPTIIIDGGGTPPPPPVCASPPCTE